MNRQRKVLITITYNEMGIIIDTKAEEVAQPNLQSTCNELATDCISRQAAIDAVREAYENDEMFDGYEYRLEELPSVQPDQRSFSCGQENDMISRQDAIEAILAVTGNSSVRELYEHVQEHGLSDMWSGGVNAAIDIIIAVPSAQPEVLACGEGVLNAQPEIVRCMDCRYHIPQDGRCRLWCQFVDPSEWCSRAKRKGGEADG